MNHPNGEPMTCKCPRGRLHNQQCPWYHPDVINIPDIENSLSTSEQAAQGKIYDIVPPKHPKLATRIMWMWYSS